MTTAVGTLNLGNGSAEAVKASLDRMKARGAKVLGLQEAGDRVQVIKQWCRENHWDYWFGDGSDGAASTPIIWEKSKKLTVTNAATKPGTDAEKAKGTGPDVVKAKVWNHIRVKPTGEDPFVFINGHLPASLYLKRRREIGTELVDVLEGLVRARDGKIAVVAVMDGNSEDTDPIWNGLQALGMKQHTKEPTLRDKAVDLTWTLDIRASDAEVVLVRSDHKGAIIVVGKR